MLFYLLFSTLLKISIVRYVIKCWRLFTSRSFSTSLYFPTILCLALLILFPGNIPAQGYGVEVRLASPPLVGTLPGKIISAAFLVTNKSAAEAAFVEDLQLPPGWRSLVSQEFPFQLKAGEMEARTIAFSIPRDAAAGAYQIQYRVSGRENSGIAAADSFMVTVLPLERLLLSVESAPDTIIAGESYEIILTLVNRGNAVVSVHPEISVSPSAPFSFDPVEVTLAPGRSQRLTMRVQSDASLARKSMQIIRVKALPAGKFEGGEEKSVAVKLLPRVSGRNDPYHRIGSRLQLSAGLEDGQFRVQAELAGSGSLDEAGRRKLDFLFRGPDTIMDGRFGKRDEYAIRYRDDNLDLQLGDGSYSLSPLLELNRYGRGVAAEFYPGRFGVGAQFLETRWDQPQQKFTGTFLQYRPDDHFTLRGNLLFQEIGATSGLAAHDDTLFSLEASFRTGKEVELNVEYGRSSSNSAGRTSDSAYRVILNGQISDKSTYRLERIYAGSDFFGYYSDTEQTNGAVTFPLSSRLYGNLSYRDNRDNLALNPVRNSIANAETSYRGGVDYYFPFGTRMTLSGEYFSKKDRLLPAEYDFDEQIASAGVVHSFSFLNFAVSLDRGLRWNRLTGNGSENVERYTFFGTVTALPRQTYGVGIVTGNNLYSDPASRTTSLNLSGEWQLLNNFRAKIDYRTNFMDKENIRRDALIANGSYTFSNKHLLTAKTYWSKVPGSSDESSFMVSYSIPLGIPVSRKSSIGVLRGRVYDSEQQGNPPLADVVLRANDVTAVSGADGTFIFPDLKPGTYAVTVDRKALGVNRVTIDKMPLLVEIASSGTTVRDFGIVRSSRIQGRLSFYGLKKEKLFEGVSEKGGVSSGLAAAALEEIKPVATLVEVASSNEVLRQYTDDRGRFSFDELRPGNWTFKVYEHDLPANYRVELEERQFELKPGEEREVSGKILPRIRTMRIIEEGEVR